MKYFILLSYLLSTYALALTTKDIERVVQKHAETIACAINDFGFKAFKVAGEPNETNSYMDRYAVVWIGDERCNGGSGSTSARISMVHVNAGSTPMVVPSATSYIESRRIKSVFQSNDLILIESIVYNEGDPNCCPTGSKTFVYSYDEDDESMKLRR